MSTGDTRALTDLQAQRTRSEHRHRAYTFPKGWRRGATYEGASHLGQPIASLASDPARLPQGGWVCAYREQACVGPYVLRRQAHSDRDRESAEPLLLLSVASLLVFRQAHR